MRARSKFSNAFRTGGLTLLIVCTLQAFGQQLEPLGTNGIIEYDLQSKNVPFVNPGWKSHTLRQGDGRGGWVIRSVDYQMLQDPNRWHTNAFGRAYLQFRVLAQMDNGELILIGVWNPSGRYGEWTNQEVTVVAFSKDRGSTWSELRQIAGAHDRPDMIADLGGGRITFQCADASYFSGDYGRSWPQKISTQRAANGALYSTEGNPLVECDKEGRVLRIAAIGYNFRGEKWHPKRWTSSFIRWSYDGGRTWRDESEPEAWRWTDTHQGETYQRGCSEGSLVRAKNGWLVAALRTDMPARYLMEPHTDSQEGLGVSVSKDDGNTWSPIERLFEAGRHHQKLLALPNGKIVMSLTVRADVRGGELLSYRRGCEAIVSRDNGLTWDLDRTIILDEYQHFDGNDPFQGACGHVNSLLLNDGYILTGHNNYLTKGISLIRWRP